MKLADIFTEACVDEVIMSMVRKGSHSGPDGIEAEALQEHIEKNGIINKVISGEYKPCPAVLTRMHTNSGKIRKIYNMSNVDRLVLKVLNQGIREAVNEILSDNCISYRQGFGVSDCCMFIKKALDSGCNYAVRLDVEDYFDNINISRILEMLRSVVEDNDVFSLIEMMLHMPVENNYKIEYTERGLLQGSPLSPILSDLYMTEFDVFVKDNYTDLFFRFSDDIAIFCKTREEAEEIYEKCVGELNNTFELNISQRKSGVFPIMARSYLGYTIVETANGKGYEVIRLDKDHKVYSNWYRTGLRQYRSEYDIVSNGILTLKDMTLLFESDEKKVRIPIETVRNINIFSEVNITSRILKWINRRGITLTVFDDYGNILGRWVPDNCPAIADTFIQQVNIYNDREGRLRLAKSFVDGELFNMKANLVYYRKHSDDSIIAETIEAMDSCISKSKKCCEYKALLLIEARAREAYYSCFNSILPSEDFVFVKRSRRPPEDAINALISFGNTVLYNYISNEIYKTSMTCKVGYLHATNKRAESLNLDIAEIFKPVIIDRVIFSIINKKMINESIHFDYGEKAVMLSAEGKRIFLTNYYKRMDSEIVYKGKKMTFRQIIWKEVISVMKHIQGNGTYKPFHYRV